MSDDPSRDETAPARDRLEILSDYEILDTPAERAFDDIVLIASQICRTPTALVSFVAADRQWFKARVGFDVCETPIAQSVCAHAVQRPGLLVIPDLTLDPRTRGNTLVTGPPHIRFYAGARLETVEGVALGTLCAIDTVPRPDGLTADQTRGLEALARQVMSQLELRRAVAARDEAALAIREGERRHRQILDSATDYAIITMDLDGLVTSWNTGAQNVLGWSEADMCGHPARIFFTDEDRAAGAPEHEMKAARAVGRGNDERWHRRKDGALFWAAGEMMPLTAEDGAHVGYLKILRDRTAERLTAERATATERALAASEERLRLAVDATRVGIFDLDVRGGTLTWDTRVRDLFGIAHDAPITYEQSFLEALHPDDKPIADAAVRAALDPAGPGVFDVEYRIRPPGGGEAWLAARGQAFVEDGRTTRFVGTVRDITARKRAETALIATEERYRLVTRATNDAIWDWDLVRDHVLWNEALSSAYGYGAAEIEPTGAWWIAHVHPDDRARVEAGIRAVIADGGDEWSHEYRFMRADGTHADVLDRGYLVRDERRPVRMIGAMLDLSDRKAAEHALQRLNEALERRVDARTRERDMVWRTSRDLFVICGTDGLCRSINPAWTEGLGYTPEFLLGQDLDMLVHPDDLAAIRAQSGRLIGAAPLRDVDLRLRARDGTYRWYSWACVPSDDEVYGAGRDITDRRHLEEQLLQAQKMEAIGQLTGGIAHDFNNLLTGIIGSLDLMQTRLAQGRVETIGRYAAAATASANRAAALTHRLLAFARRQPLDPKPTDANRLLASLEDLLRRSIGEAIGLEIVTAPDLWPTLCDPNQLENAIINLAINARDAMPEGGTLRIETLNIGGDEGRVPVGQAPEFVGIRVTDTGGGMAPDVVARAFEPFFTTKPLGEGTGLGLSMVYGFARQSDGHAQIQSEIGRGTSVLVCLPRHHGEAARAGAAAGLSEVHRAGDGETVLVVEDDPVVRELIVEVLQDLGYAVLAAQDGPGGLAAASSIPRIDLLVTDVGLPGLNGRQLVEQVRAVRPALKVLFITGYAEDAIFGEGDSDPRIQMITKPFAVEALAQRIRDMIGAVPAP